VFATTTKTPLFFFFEGKCGLKGNFVPNKEGKRGLLWAFPHQKKKKKKKEANQIDRWVQSNPVASRGKGISKPSKKALGEGGKNRPKIFPVDQFKAGK